jgi:hypothetical protein
MNATLTFLETQVVALQEAIERKDAYIVKLEDQCATKSEAIFNAHKQQQALINSIKDFVIEQLKSDDMSQDTAEMLADLCDFELTKTVTVTATVDFEIELTVPLDVDMNDVIASTDFTAEAYGYDFDDVSVSTRDIDWSDTIS